MARLVAAALLLALSASRARADDVPLDIIEKYFGATHVNAVAGHGALTAGFSADGDLTVLAWPSPGFADQLDYDSSNALDARDQPHFGALDDMGAFLGLRITTAAGRSVTWLRDAPWTHVQGYTQPDAPVVRTTFERDDLGLTVTITDVVAPDVDALSRGVTVTRAAGSPVLAIELVVYENLSPTLSAVPELPLLDWAIDFDSDFLAAWDADAQAILHFHPGDVLRFSSFVDLVGLQGDVDYGAVEDLMKAAAPASADVDAFVAGIDATYTPGVAALVTTEPPPTAFQVGSDDAPLCAFLGSLLDNLLALPDVYPGLTLPIDPQAAMILRCTDALPRLRTGHGWLWQPRNALDDVTATATEPSGELSGSQVAAGQTNGALVTALDFAGGDSASATVIFAFGATRGAARATLDAVRAQPFADRQSASEAAAHNALAGIPLPSVALGDRVVAVAQRALVNLYVARDRASGAFLASVTRQPPYYLDWPRDGSFLSVALDLGAPPAVLDWVTTRHEWYAGLLRANPTTGNPVLTPVVPVDPTTGAMTFPANVWEMNYFVDGREGGPIRFEIDNTALHIWATVVHTATLTGAARADFAAKVWPADKAALDVLVRWTDPTTGLPAPANEDDDAALTSTIDGAATVYTALISGARLAHYLNDDGSARRYLERSAVLANAIDTAYRDPGNALYAQSGTINTGLLGPTGWLIWPARFLSPADPALEGQLDHDMDLVLKSLDGTGPGATYVAKNIVAAALYGAPNGSQAKALAALQLLANIATPDTLAFGEVFIPTTAADGSGAVVWSNRTATPHVWEGMLFYLSAMALSDPGLFNVEERELPLPPPAGGGCAVSEVGSASGSRWGWLIGMAFLALLRSTPSRHRRRADRRAGSASRAS